MPSITVLYYFLSSSVGWEEYTYFVEEPYNDRHFIANSRSRIIVDKDYMMVGFAFAEGCLDYFFLKLLKV